MATLVDALGIPADEAVALLKRHATVERAANAHLHAQGQVKRHIPPGPRPAKKPRTITSFFKAPPSSDP